MIVKRLSHYHKHSKEEAPGEAQNIYVMDNSFFHQLIAFILPKQACMVDKISFPELPILQK
jgi:hypothetical protein